MGSGNREEALEILKGIVFSNDVTYSSLSLFLIINQNLIKDNIEVSNLFDHLIDNNNFSKELENLLIYKKALLNSDFVSESELLESMKPLLNSDTLWKAHGLVLLGDYFLSKGERLKAIEFYQKIFTINNLQNDFYNHASWQLANIADE